MAWPNNRLVTFTPGSKIQSNVLNALQDAVVGVQHGVITRSISLRPTNLGSFSGFSQFFESAAGGLTMYNPLDFLRGGDRLLQLDARVLGNGVVDCTYNLRGYTDETAGTVLAGFTDSNRAAAYGTLNLYTGSFIVSASEIVWLTMTANAALYRIAKLIATWDHP